MTQDDRTTSDRPTRSPALQVVGSVIFLALLVTAALVWLHYSYPKDKPVKLEPFSGYDRQAMRDALTPDAVGAELQTIIGYGSRYLGQDGFYKTEEHIRKAIQDNGLELLEQDDLAPAPRTLERRFVTAFVPPPSTQSTTQPTTRPSEVEIYPFIPNHIQPIVTPAEGVSGKLLLVSDDVILHRPRFDDCIALIDAAAPPSNYAINWMKYAQVGFKAVIIAHREGLEKIDWKSITQMAASVPVNYVRLAANERIFDYLDQDITLHVRTEFHNTPHKTLIGVLKASKPTPNAEALVLFTSYDAFSVLPDRAPGTMSAISLATQLAMIKGMVPYRNELKRDVIFVFQGSQVMAHTGTARLLSALGPNIDAQGALVRLQNELAEEQASLATAQAAQACFVDPKYLADSGATRKGYDALLADRRAFFDDQIRYVLNTIVLERSEDQLDARVAFLRGNEDTTTPAYDAFMAKKRYYDQALDAAGVPTLSLVDSRQPFLQESNFRQHAADRFDELHDYHAARVKTLQGDIAINKLLKGYHLVVFETDLAPTDPAKSTAETVSFYMGEGAESFNYVQHPRFNNLLLSVLQKTEAGAAPTFISLRAGNHSGATAPLVNSIPTGVRFWNSFYYPSFTLVNTDRTDAYQAFGYPVQLPYMTELKTLTQSLRMAADTALSLAQGNGDFAAPLKVNPYTLTGNVYAANVGQSIVPNYPVANALFFCKLPTGQFPSPPYYRYAMQFTDPYGRYNFPTWSTDVNPPDPPPGYNPAAAMFGKDGLIHFIKDEGIGQSLYKSNQLALGATANIVVFRAAPVTILDLINPQTLKSYVGVDFITRDGLASTDRVFTELADDALTTFVQPDRWFYMEFKAGSLENELATATRAFVLGVNEPGYTPNPSKEIDGRGYLAQDTPLLLDVPLKIAESMLWVNGQRLKLQEKHAMADQRTVEFDARARNLLEDGKAPNVAKHEQLLMARDAVTYATLNHPVLRESIFEAVVGILWYLGLLVPFVFFFEKLVFGFTDIRKQLLAQAIIFLIVFFLLRLLHPAFEMIRSSLMILLSFVIMLISGGITILFAGRFQENLEDLKKKRGIVAAADVNTMGVIGTAFMLGLNNMHRRRVRTGLTCATLVLITFAMICFTSIQSDVVDTVTAIGKAPYQGFLVKRELMTPLTPGELFALQTKYGHRFKIAQRQFYVGERTWEQQQFNAEFNAVFEPKEASARQELFDSMLILSPDEPLKDKILSETLLTNRGWFTADHLKADAPLVVMIPDVMAGRLGVSVQDVNEGSPKIKVNGKECVVWGIFRSDSFNAIRDLDGQSLLPPDIEGIVNLQLGPGGQVLAAENDPLLGSEKIMIVPRVLGVPIPHSSPANAPRLVSVAIPLDTPEFKDSYKAAKEVIDQYLEQSGQQTYYGLDNVAYRGKRARERSLGGVLELLIPLIVAAFTVLNTMRGSVYERRDEIFVYNAVGIAPQYVFFMFFAEAFVYAVVGSVLGYVLSQGTGRILTTMNLTGGLNMTFTSISTILASLAITGAVFISTYFPARSARRIAAPAEDSGWELPEPDGDAMTLALPFTFDQRDRIAVLEYFNRYFLDRGEGSAGKFFAGLPKVGVSPEVDPLAEDAYIPQLSVVTWLKPFDLGVSQELSISLPTDPETREFIALMKLTRLSGSRESWMRLNQAFVGQIRKQFLNWRAVGDAEREEMFEDARRLLEAGSVLDEVTVNG